MKRTSHLAALLFAVLCLLLATPAQAWWKSDWTSRKKITVDTAGQTDAIGTVTVLVRLHDGNFDFDGAKPDGSDIRFVASDDKTVLPCQIEKYDSLLNQAFVWVNVPDVKAGDKVDLFLYYGNKNATAQEKGTWSDDASLVYHFSESGEPCRDATGNGNSPATVGTADPGSLIGGGLRLPGTAVLTIPASPSLAWTAGQSLTWSAWLKSAENAPGAVLFSRQDGGGTFQIGLDNGVPYVEVNGARGNATSGALAVNTWKRLTVIASGAVISLYVDGAPAGTLAAALPALNGPTFLGGDNSGGTGFNGTIDELEIYKSALPLGALKLTTVNQGPDADAANKMLTVGPPEAAGNLLSGFSFGYVGIILGSVTIDGWVIIGMLIIMATLSWRVNIQKYGYLKHQTEANNAFLQVWENVGTDLTVLEDSDRFKEVLGDIDEDTLDLIHESSLYRIYHVGASEIKKRLTLMRGGSRILSAQSIEAIRASLAGQFEREVEIIENDLVYMKVAISGGPFIGLLGTVVGVMITFAAIAAAGDVNVNAIAPGISAALVATAAGLLVAIPAMFGYNYLVGRIKHGKTKMRIFIDEFVTRLAEFYRPQSGHVPKGESAYVDAH